MDQADILITNVRPLISPMLEIETNDKKKYLADLSDFKAVYCFPKVQSEWEAVSISSNGYNLTWSTRFEVHVGQVIDCAQAVSQTKLQA